MKRLTKHHRRLNSMHVNQRSFVSIWKNPRKLKKAMKRILTDLFEQQHDCTMKALRCRLHWVPGRGWTVTQKLPLAIARQER